MSDDKNKNIDVVRDHSFDGIEEFDNRLPNWWLFILYATILFALGYWFIFHIFGIGGSSAERYAAEQKAGIEAQMANASPVTDEGLIAIAVDPERVAEGQALFGQFCVACHLPQGQGIVGPNLTDSYWIHGATPSAIHTVIDKGILSKGMVAWGPQLGPQKLESLVAFVLSIKGTNVPGKAPEGELVE